VKREALHFSEGRMSLEWLGNYNPEKFDPIKVEFRDSTRKKKKKQQKRWLSVGD
jgi:hypothetical protein